MNKVDHFSVVESERDPKPRIRLQRGDTGALIDLDAAALLVQYEASFGDVLLVLDEDCIYEEQLHLVLVRDGNVIDHIVIGGWYSTGIFDEAGVDEDTLSFRFANDRLLRLKVDSKGSWLPGRLAGGARRKGGWLDSRFLRLTAGES